MNIVAEDDGLGFATLGMRSEDGHEICARVDDPRLVGPCRDFVRYVADYIEQGNPIVAGQTLAYGYWIAKAVSEHSGRLCFWERSPGGGDYVPGITNLLRYWSEQQTTCQHAGARFTPHSGQQMIVVSDGVMEGDVVQGVRYPSPPHMSGWWLTTDRYGGNTASLRVVHAHHVTAGRPDLVRFLALDYGYRFYSDDGEVRFDEKVAADE